jgi:hypothetical protein
MFRYFATRGADLAKVAYALSKEHYTRQAMSGPAGDDIPGTIYCNKTQADGSDAGFVGYYPDHQKWMPVPKTDKTIWVGIDERFPPTAESLQRPVTLESKSVEVEGQKWLIPVARTFVEIEAGEKLAPIGRLSNYIKLNEEGEWTYGDVEKQFETLWAAGFRYWEHFCNTVMKLDENSEIEGDLNKDAILDDFELAELAVVALQTNYHLGPMEASMLNLLTPITITAILAAVIDLETYGEFAKKKEQQRIQEELSKGSSGSSEGTETTSQPLPIAS